MIMFQCFKRVYNHTSVNNCLFKRDIGLVSSFQISRVTLYYKSNTSLNLAVKKKKKKKKNVTT